MKKCSLRGFTLTELMIVIAIIGMVVSMLLPPIAKYQCQVAMGSYVASFKPTKVVNISCVWLDPDDGRHRRCTADFLDVENQPKKLVADCDWWNKTCTVARP